MIVFLKKFGYVWSTIAALLWMWTLIRIWSHEGLARVRDLLLPWHNVLGTIVYYLEIVLLFSPAFIAFWLAHYLERKQEGRHIKNNVKE